MDAYLHELSKYLKKYVTEKNITRPNRSYENGKNNFGLRFFIACGT